MYIYRLYLDIRYISICLMLIETRTRWAQLISVGAMVVKYNRGEVVDRLGSKRPQNDKDLILLRPTHSSNLATNLATASASKGISWLTVEDKAESPTHRATHQKTYAAPSMQSEEVCLALGNFWWMIGGWWHWRSKQGVLYFIFHFLLCFNRVKPKKAKLNQVKREKVWRECFPH